MSLKKSIQDIPVLNWFLRVLRYAVNSEDITSGALALCDKEYGAGVKEKAAIALCREYWESGQKESIIQQKIEEQQGIEKQQKIEAVVDSEEAKVLKKCGPPLLMKMLHFKKACEDGLMVGQLMDYFELKQYLAPTSATFLEDVEAVECLLTRIAEYLKEEQQTLYEGIRLFLNHAALYGMSIFENKIDIGKDSVKLMTLHASKGLEFSHVFITGINYGLIPLQSKGMDAEEEERRLFFVGLTRAKDYLELSYYTSPEQYRAMPGPSRFLSMIPAKLVTDESKQGGTVMDTNARLQEIKRQILASRTEMQYLFPEGENHNKKSAKEDNVKANHTKENHTIEMQRISENGNAAAEKKKAQNVSHAKYGTGVIVREDEDTVTVNFEGYGEKEFLKLFCELQYLD